MTTRETKRGRPPKVESPSDLTNRMAELEAAQLRQTELLGNITEQLKNLNKPSKLPLTESPEARINAMKQAKVGGEPVSSSKSFDKRHPDDAKTGFLPQDIIYLAETSEKYDAYQLDDKGEPVKQIYEYHCQACPRIEEYAKGPSKKICVDCKSTMLKTSTGKYEKGAPAYGVVQNYMYTTKKRGRKYKVYFEKFSERQTSEGLVESEMVLCQR